MSLFRVVVVIISPGYTINPWPVFYFIYFSNRQPENATVPPHHNQFPPVKERRRKRAEQDGRERKKDCLSRQLVVSRADQTWISDRSWFSISFSSSRCWGTRQQTASVGLFLLLLLLCLFAVCVDYTHMWTRIVPWGPPQKTWFPCTHPSPKSNRGYVSQVYT